MAGKRLAHPESGEDIVISGLSGTYPNSLNVHDFGEKLFNKTDLISDCRWKIKHPEIPNRCGKIFEIEKFDPAFFGIPYKQANSMDPMSRIMLEKTFEAIVDAGMNPAELRGTNTGVFVGVCYSESEKTLLYEKQQANSSTITGCLRGIIPNRISYWLGVDGPSYTVDTACSSSLCAFEQAYRAIRSGQCDTAIVGGSNLCLHYNINLQFFRLGVLNMDGKCKCFDSAANGYTRSEAVVVVVLQKSKDARRVYCQLIHAKTNCDGHKEQGITYPSGKMQATLLNEVYEECELDPINISYVEAHGTGTSVGDPEELLAIEKVFCPETRRTTLMIGSVKSNIGHSEPASGLCSITKVIIAMEAGHLIPNNNFSNPRTDIKSLQDGRIKVVTDKMMWNGGYAAINSFGFGGANCHIILKSYFKEKINHGLPNDDIPRLVYLSGRTEEAVNTILDDMLKRPMDAELIGLLHEIYKYDIPVHNYRGYAVFTKSGTVSRELEYFSYDNKPLWFVFSGLGSQYLSMATDFMKIPIFVGVIEKCHKILSPKGINITDILTKTEPHTFAKQTNTFIAITSIQIALFELLKYINLKPAGIIGHSIGEIACAYCDGCLTLEQTLLCSYYLGQASDYCKNSSGIMVSVEAELRKVQEFLIPGVEIAGINSEKNCLVSGPTNNIQYFVTKLRQHNILYEEIYTNVAYHSSNVKEIASFSLKYLKPIVPKPKERSENWLSTVNTNSNKTSTLCSAEFLSSILVNSIHFEENYRIIPKNAISLEISPSGVLQNILQRSIYDDGVIISIMNKNATSLENLMTAIGKLYNAGYNPRIENIYPKIAFPVSRETPMLSHLIKWDHSAEWFVPNFDPTEMITTGERSFTVNIKEDEQQFIAGHKIDGRILYPATGYLALVWETVGMVQGRKYTDLSITFENVKFHRATHISKDVVVSIFISVHKISGLFEVFEGGSAIVTGRIIIPDGNKNEMNDRPIPVPEYEKYYVPLSSRDIYKELRLRGYNYSGLFRGLQSCDTTATIGQITWKQNWVAFMDTVLQMHILQEDTRGLFVPTAIDNLIINAPKHKKIIESLPENGTIPVYVYRRYKTIVCGGVEIRGLQASAISHKKNLSEPVIETYKFIPHNIAKTNLTLIQSVRILLHIVLENILVKNVRTTEMLDEYSANNLELISPIVVESLADLPLIQPDVNILTTNPIDEISNITISNEKLISESNSLIVIATNILKREQVMQAALNAIIKGGFILARESLDLNLLELDLSKINIIADHELKSERLFLLSKVSDTEIKSFIDLTDFDFKFDWLQTLQNTLKTDQSPCIYSQGDECSGLIGFTNCLRREPGIENVTCMLIMDKNAPEFDPKNEFYTKQLKKHLKVNVLKNGQWGTYRHMLMKETKTVQVEHAYVNTTVRGDLSSLRWLEGNLSRNAELDCNRILVHVYYSAMNFRDIMTATGRIAPEVIARGRFEQECVQGLEFSGRLINGQRVIGMVTHLATATLVVADPLLLWDIPEDWSLEEAVTIPVAYGTVLYSFVNQGKIRPGMSILIHCGTGGVGQAAINIALHYGCKVYTTVGTPEKREFIKKNWPEIKDNQIGNSRDTSFEQMIMTETNGRGVDMVLNSLAEEKLESSVRCLAYGGKFLEIGKFDLSKDNPLLLNIFEKGISFHGVMLDTFFSTVNNVKQSFYNLIKSSIKSGAIKPLHKCIFKEDEIEETFRYMASGKHMGKVLIKIREEEPETITEPPLRLVKALSRYCSTANGSFIVIGGLGGFGLELADWLILRGVRNLVLTTRKGIRTGYQAMRVKIWKSYGVNIMISTADTTTYDGCHTIIQQATTLGPVEAIFNLAVVLRDGLFANLTKDDYTISFGGKAVATKYLDELSRELCPNLKQFVVFSSVSCGRGNAGQTNYGMANSIMERICEKRHEDGFPALAIEWGAIGDVGLVAELQEEHNVLVIGGTLQQRISNCLSVLDKFLKQNEPLCASMLVAEKRAGVGDAGSIVDVVSNILGVKDIKTVGVHSSLAELGMDSIMAVEIKQTLEREFEVFLTPQDIRSMTFGRLLEIELEQKSKETNKDEALEEMIKIPDIGMHFIARAIGEEENSDKRVVVLPSKATPNTKEKVILIPGIDGTASVLGTLAANLSAHAIVLQLGFSRSTTTIQEMAQLLLDRTLDIFPDLQNEGFTIVAYSYGGTIALELAAMLEIRGAIGKLVFIDSAPEMLRLLSQKFVNSNDTSVIQNNILSNILIRIVSADIAGQLLSVVADCSTWESKIDTLLTYSPESMDFSPTHLKNVCNAIYLRTNAILNYNSTVGKLKSSLKLIKPREPTVRMAEEDFGLSEYCNDPVEIVYVDGNHIVIIDNPECSLEVDKFVLKENI